MLVATVRKTRWGYKGIVRCMDANRILWTEKAGIDRPSREDALEDALLRKKDREACWSGGSQATGELEMERHNPKQIEDGG